MILPPTPENEAQRLAALRRYAVLDTQPEPAFDEIVWLAAYICGTPISFISLVDAHRQWFKAKIGLNVSETSRATSFCAHAIIGGDLLVVPDTLQDPRFADNPYVLAADSHVRFYAGVPLVTDDGYALGTLCVIDRVVRELSAEQSEALRALGRQAVAQFDLRRRVDELQNAYLYLQELERLKSQFVAMVSHEMRTPLTSISGGLQLVLADPVLVLEQDYRQLLSNAQGSADRLVRLTSDILDLSKIEAGKFGLLLRTSEILPIVRAACSAVDLPGVDGRIVVRMSEGLPSIQADPDRLVQALVNLLGNAVKFSPASTTVALSVVARQKRVEIAVSDEGPGMTAADLAQLFTPFQQLEGGRKAGGTGLGLTICKAIVEQHGGSLLVDSTPGRGTTITVVLPASPVSGVSSAS